MDKVTKEEIQAMIEKESMSQTIIGNNEMLKKKIGIENLNLNGFIQIERVGACYTYGQNDNEPNNVKVRCLKLS